MNRLALSPTNPARLAIAPGGARLAKLCGPCCQSGPYIALVSCNRCDAPETGDGMALVRASVLRGLSPAFAAWMDANCPRSVLSQPFADQLVFRLNGACYRLIDLFPCPYDPNCVPGRPSASCYALRIDTMPADAAVVAGGCAASTCAGTRWRKIIPCEPEQGPNGKWFQGCADAFPAGVFKVDGGKCVSLGEAQDTHPCPDGSCLLGIPNWENIIRYESCQECQGQAGCDGRPCTDPCTGRELCCPECEFPNELWHCGYENSSEYAINFEIGQTRYAYRTVDVTSCDPSVFRNATETLRVKEFYGEESVITNQISSRIPAACLNNQSPCFQLPDGRSCGSQTIIDTETVGGRTLTRTRIFSVSLSVSCFNSTCQYSESTAIMEGSALIETRQSSLISVGRSQCVGGSGNRVAVAEPAKGCAGCTQNLSVRTPTAAEVLAFRRSMQGG